MDLLLSTFQNQNPGWQRERLLALKLALEGKDSEIVAKDLGRSPTTIKSWIDKFRQGGVDGLLSKGKGIGPKSQLTPEMQSAMIE